MCRVICVSLLEVIFATVPMSIAPPPSQPASHAAQRDSTAGPGTAAFDPVRLLNASFPHSTELKNNGRLLEFCPDGTCDGFVATAAVSVTSLKDFAYLYEYFFSDFIYMPEWRASKGATDGARRILGKTEYRGCAKSDDHEMARCILLDLSRNGRVKLIFVRYDEGERGVTPMDLAKQLSGDKSSGSNQEH